MDKTEPAAIFAGDDIAFAPSRRRLFWPAWAVFGLGLVLTSYAGLETHSHVDREALARFAFSCDQVTLKIEERLGAYALILNGAAGLLAASDGVDRGEWRAYVETLRASGSVPGVQGIGFAELIPPGGRLEHEERVRGEGFPDYKVMPPGERAIMTSIVYLEPFSDRNLRAFGYDMFSEPVRRSAMEQARDSGAAALSGKVELLQETGQDVQAGTLMYVPVYRRGMATATVEQRRAALVGWAYSPYRMNDLMGGILADWGGDHRGDMLHLHIYDGDLAAPDRLLFDSVADGVHEASVLSQIRTIDFNGQRWLLKFNPESATLALAAYAPVWLVLVGGVLISGLLCGLLLTLRNTRSRAARIAAALTTEVRAREVVLKESEAFKQAVLNAMPAEIAVLDQEGVILAVNEPWRQFARENATSPGELPSDTDVGSNYFAVCASAAEAEAEAEDAPDDSAATAFRGIRAVLDGARASFSTEYRCDAPAKRRWFAMDVTSLGIAGRKGAVVTHTEITERKHVEARLASLLEEQKAILQSEVVGFVILRARVMTWMNPAFARMLGYDPDELIGQPTRGFYPDEASYLAFRESAYTVISAGGVFRTQIQYLRRDGVLNWFDISGARLHPDGEDTIWAFVDIAAQKRSEAELVEARERAQQASLAKSRFLATMSHEIRTPMNSIFGMAQLLQMRDITESERQGYARAVLDAGQALLALLDDILDLSKVEAGKVTLDRVLFEPAPLLEQVRTLHAQAAGAKGLLLQVAWNGPADVRYEGDPFRLRQMLSNLVGNAIKFTARGHVRVEARECVRNGEEAELEFSVIDSGIGVASDKQALLFQPFSQADSSTTREYGGTGLGLSIVRNLARLMGGEAGLDSQAECGARFWFRVRVALAAGDGAPRRTLAGSGPMARMSGRVLVVEDHPANRTVIGALLGKLGVSVVLAEDGQQAIDAIGRNDLVDLVLMDVQMPVMDGYAATEQIRRREAQTGRARVPIVALTADAFEEVEVRCRAVGMDDFLVKPIALDALRAVLERWLPATPAALQDAAQAPRAGRENEDTDAG